MFEQDFLRLDYDLSLSISVLFCFILITRQTQITSIYRHGPMMMMYVWIIKQINKVLEIVIRVYIGFFIFGFYFVL